MANGNKGKIDTQLIKVRSRGFLIKTKVQRTLGICNKNDQNRILVVQRTAILLYVGAQHLLKRYKIYILKMFRGSIAFYKKAVSQKHGCRF
jgi:hypothetical protein